MRQIKNNGHNLLPPLPTGLFAILDPQSMAGSISLASVIEEFVECECTPLIVRSTGLDPDAYKRLIAEVDALRQVISFDYLIHRHIDVISSCDAIGVHMPAKAFAPSNLRHQLGIHRYLGYSAHSLDEAWSAKTAGADYVIAGSVFHTPKCDDGHPVLGLSTLSTIIERIGIPVYAIGGIHAENISFIRQVHAKGFCALRSIYQDNNLAHHIQKLQYTWGLSFK